MRNFFVKCPRIPDPRMEVTFFNAKQFVLEEWKDCLREEKKIADGLNSIKFLKFDQILQQQLYNISFPMIRFRFFGASKITRKLSKPPKIITMDHFWLQIGFFMERKKITLDIKDFVFLVRYGIHIHDFDFFKSKLFYAINMRDLRIFFRLTTMDQLLKAVDLIPNLYGLAIGFQEENLVVNNDDFEILTRKIGNKTNLHRINFTNFKLPNNWEKICKENFKTLPNFINLSLSRPVPNISINVIDLHDLMTETNISVSLWNVQDDSFVELPEFKDRFKLTKPNLNERELFISNNNESYFYPVKKSNC